MPLYNTFGQAIHETRRMFAELASQVQTDRWQSIPCNKPEMVMKEVILHDIGVRMKSEILDYYRRQIGPNLPWADDHFAERVSGTPMNPGDEWRRWPWGHSAANFLDLKGKRFNHNYMERYWPKFAHSVSAPTATALDWLESVREKSDFTPPMRGIRNDYGDLGDLIALLAKEPTTRQAYLPIWFPEDTGVGNEGRKPCSLGYHFLMRGDELHCSYYIRSCDLIRHFRDDIYLTVRLVLWIIDQVRQQNPEWSKVRPGMFKMHIASLHCFINDFYTLRQELGMKP